MATTTRLMISGTPFILFLIYVFLKSGLIPDIPSPDPDTPKPEDLSAFAKTVAELFVDNEQAELTYGEAREIANWIESASEDTRVGDVLELWEAIHIAGENENIDDALEAEIEKLGLQEDGRLSEFRDVCLTFFRDFEAAARYAAIHGTKKKTTSVRSRVGA